MHNCQQEIPILLVQFAHAHVYIDTCTRVTLAPKRHASDYKQTEIIQTNIWEEFQSKVDLHCL